MMGYGETEPIYYKAGERIKQEKSCMCGNFPFSVLLSKILKIIIPKNKHIIKNIIIKTFVFALFILHLTFL